MFLLGLMPDKLAIPSKKFRRGPKWDLLSERKHHFMWQVCRIISLYVTLQRLDPDT